MNILDLLVGKPLATTEERAEQVGPLQGIPIFGLDALSSAAYGPEAALTLLIPLGLLGLNYIIPVSAAIIALLIIVYFSYLQTIAAYPGGGGSYTVARFNLGARPSLLAAAALLTDYILTAAVGISAGVGALISAVPSLQPHTLSFCLSILLVVMIVNLRGLREAGLAFMVPTYLFVGTLLIVIGAGLLAIWRSGGHPAPLTPLPPPSAATEAVSYWLLMKGFARRCRAIAQNNYLPHAFRFRGRRLVYPYGIVTLGLLTALLLIFFDGVTDKLIPLYAVGAFLAFTLSQAGMVVHWYKKRGPHWRKSAIVNGLGAFVTGITVCVVLVAKFAEGAWITLLFIPLLIVFFGFVRRHYHAVRMRTASTVPVLARHAEPPIAVVAIDRWSSISKQGLEFAAKISNEIIGVHVEPDKHSELLKLEWQRYVEPPFREAGHPPPRLVLLPSPYRFVIVPIIQYILDLSAKQPQRRIVVVIPELVEGHWYEFFLHNQRGRSPLAGMDAAGARQRAHLHRQRP